MYTFLSTADCKIYSVTKILKYMEITVTEIDEMIQ